MGRTLPALLSFALFFCLPLLNGCREAPPTATPTFLPSIGSEAAAVAPTPRPQIVVEGGLGQVHTLNPLLDPHGPLADKLFDSLLRLNPEDGSLEPGLAENWRASGLTFTFTLRSGVSWHDGRAFQAEDVAFTFSAVQALGERSPLAPALTTVESFSAPDEKTFVVNLKKKNCAALYNLGLIPLIPRPEGEDNPVGTGPFLFEGRTEDGGIRLRRNQHYYRGAPRLEEWLYRPAADENALLAGLRAGKIDVARLREGEREMEREAEIKIYRYPRVGADYYFIAYNNEHPILSDRRARLALAHALDRHRILDEALGGAGELLPLGLPPGHWALPENLSPPDFDPEKARQLLTQAGWQDKDGDGIREKEGQPLNLLILANAENPIRRKVAFLVRGYYQAVGVGAEVGILDWTAFLENLFIHRFDLAVFSWPLELSPDQMALWHSAEIQPGRGFNFVSYDSLRADILLEAGRSVAGCDAQICKEIYRKLYQQIAKDLPYDFLFATDEFLAVSHRIAGPAPSPFAGPFWNVGEWRLEFGG